MARAHGAYKPGEVIDLPERQAQSLIAWEYATEVRDNQQTLIETASVEPVAESADITPRRRRKG
ncbi:MAG: hypothetical protein EBR82_35670 [Caulobacteraceae bacterium]|nr:hypothetical protein [Caulobacteraceae bacterium]